MTYVEMYEQLVKEFVLEQLSVCQDRLNRYEMSHLSQFEVPNLENYIHMPYPHKIPPNTAMWTCNLLDYNFNNGILDFTVLSVNHQQPYEFTANGVAMYRVPGGGFVLRDVVVHDTIPNLAKIRLSKKEGIVRAPEGSEFMWFNDDLHVFHCTKHFIQGKHKKWYRHDILSIIKYTFENSEFGIKASFGVDD